jgi:predicted phage tail protein
MHAAENVTRSLIMKLPAGAVVFRHPKAWGSLCLAVGTWLVFLGAILCGYGFWWGAALIAVAALELWIAFHLLSSGQGIAGH